MVIIVKQNKMLKTKVKKTLSSMVVCWNGCDVIWRVGHKISIRFLD